MSVWRSRYNPTALNPQWGMSTADAEAADRVQAQDDAGGGGGGGGWGSTAEGRLRLVRGSDASPPRAGAAIADGGGGGGGGSPRASTAASSTGAFEDNRSFRNHA